MGDVLQNGEHQRQRSRLLCDGRAGSGIPDIHAVQNRADCETPTACEWFEPDVPNRVTLMLSRVGADLGVSLTAALTTLGRAGYHATEAAEGRVYAPARPNSVRGSLQGRTATSHRAELQALLGAKVTQPSIEGGGPT